MIIDKKYAGIMELCTIACTFKSCIFLYYKFDK